MKYTAVIFDFDYTLADATPAIVSCVNDSLGILGLAHKPEGAIRKTVGMTLKNTFHVLTGISDDALASRFVALFKEEADRIMTANTTLFPETVGVLSGLKAAGCQTGIVTSKLHYRIDEVLEKYGIAHLIDCIVGFEDVRDAKPSPAGLLQAVDRLGVKRDAVLYIGDNQIDAQAAANAGIDFAAVTTGTHAAPEFADLPHLLIAGSLIEIYNRLIIGQE